MARLRPLRGPLLLAVIVGVVLGPANPAGAATRSIPNDYPSSSFEQCPNYGTVGSIFCADKALYENGGIDGNYPWQTAGGWVADVYRLHQRVGESRPQWLRELPESWLLTIEGAQAAMCTTVDQWIEDHVPDLLGLNTVAGWVGKAVCRPVQLLADVFVSALRPVWGALSFVWGVVGGIVWWAFGVVVDFLIWPLSNAFYRALLSLGALWNGVTSVASNVWSIVVDQSDVDQARDHVSNMVDHLDGFGQNITNLASSISVDDSPQSYCVSVAGSELCPLAFFQGDSPPFGLNVLVIAWTGFWVLFLFVQSVGWMARVTDS